MADTSWRRALSEDEIPAAFRNVYGDRSETPLSVQMADVGVEFTPAGTIFGINDIKEELQKEEPDYYKIGMMAGAEAVGLIPGLGDAAVAAIKAGAKKAGLDNVANQVNSLLSGPKADDAVKTEMFGGVGMKGVSTDSNFKMAQKLLKKKIKSRKSSDLTAAADQKALTEGPIPRVVNKEIWEETGWFVNPLDGQWRYYIDDRDSVLTSFEEIFKPNGEFNFKQVNQSNLPEDQAKKVTLGNLLQHNNLYERYPDLKDREIYFFADNSESGKKLLGKVTNEKIYINLAGEKYKDFEDIHDVLLHEIQHVIQRKEGFVPGASETHIPEELVVKRDSEIANLRKPIQAEVDQLKREEGAIRGRILEEVENAKTPLPGLTAEQELEIFRAKPYNSETMDTEGPSWAALGREYGVSPKIAQKAWGRVNMLDHLRGKEKELDQAIAMKQAELFGLDNESFNIETNFYEGAGGEIEARTVQSMFRGAGDGEFPLDTQTNMLSVERPTVFEYRGDEGVDAINYEQKPRKEPEKAQTSSILDRIRNRVGLNQNSVAASGFTLEDFGYYVDNPAKWGNTDWAKQKQAVAEKYAREGGKSAKKLLSGPQTAFLGIDSKKPLYLDTDFLSTLRGANDEVTDMSNPKYVDLKKSVEKEGFLPDQKGNKILIGINHKGEAFIMEGNNRVAIAKEFGAPSVKAEVKYYNGAEEVDGPYSPQNILKYASQAPRQFAEGGTVDMNQQMSFAFEDGGLRDDGMRQDPVSGNEVPSGSMAKEVRDDIPAQLSEGEYVVPADVVRYYGVKFFEDIRDAAKMGLRDMEARGRIGGEPVPAGGPMNNDDLSPEEMAAISEMMGMAQGGAVDMYKQQQNMYNPPAQAVGNPMQQMNAGGAVRGYNQAGSVTSQTTEQDMLNAADAVNQSRASGTSMMGAPLGFSIYRPQAEIDAEAQGAIDEVTPEPEKVTLYSPEGVPIELELPRDQATYEALLAQGYTTEVVAKTPQPRGSDDGGGGDDPTPDPTAWMKQYDYTDANKLAEQTAATLEKGSLFGGMIGAIGKMSNVAQANANIALLEAQGINTDSLKKKRDNYIKNNGLTIIQNTIPGIMDGDQLKAQVERTIGSDLFKNTPKPSQTTPPPTEPTPPSSGGDDGPTFTEELRAKQKEESTKAISLAKAKATGIAAQAKNQGKTIAEVSQTGSKGYGNESAASVATGGQGNQGLGSGAGGMNKGGLMATKPKRKTKRQYKKGGLAGKK